MQEGCSASLSCWWAPSWLTCSPHLRWFSTHTKKLTVKLWLQEPVRSGWPWCLTGAQLFIPLDVVPGTFSTTGPLFPLKDFMGLPTHHVLHALQYWLLKVALNTISGSPSSSFTGCWWAGKPSWLSLCERSPHAGFIAKMMKYLFCLPCWMKQGALQSATSSFSRDSPSFSKEIAVAIKR